MRRCVHVIGRSGVALTVVYASFVGWKEREIARQSAW